MSKKSGKIISITIFLLLFWLLIYSYSPLKFKSEVGISAVTNKVCDLQQFGDINCDGHIDLADFEIWRKGFFSFNFPPTITVVPSIVPTCIPRPPCLDATPSCLLPEPIDGWCPTVTPSQSPTAEPTQQPTIPVTVIPSITQGCMWCGTNCVSSKLDIACPMVMPPADMKCEYVNFECKIVPLVSPASNIR